MAVASDVPKESFRLSMLIYDTRYRSITIQIFVLLLFALFVSWLISNTISNLAIRGKEFNFGFLWSRAGYDIGQALIPYSNDSSHLTALFVGLVNTLVVALLGCVLATILGVIIGVLRLSKNWLVGRLMTVYVEMFRNVPLLLWILLSYVILSETTPQPRDFRVTDEMAAAGEAPAASMMLFDTVAVTNRGTNIPSPLFDVSLGSVDLGFMSVNLTILAYILVIAGSVWINRRILAAARARQEATGDRPVTWWKSLLVLFGPVIALSVGLGLHLEIPELKGFNFAGGILVAHSFTALLIALTLYTAAFIAEIVRAGIMAINRGQSEAAFALGLRPGRTMNLIILPQALRVIIPPLISQFLNLTKNTSLGIAVSYLDLRGTLGGITLNQTGRELECMLLMMLIYLTISLIISALMNLYNSSVQIKAR
ncbi:ABC transporter permease subunit [Rhodobacteraceae bacterium HSP-20]|uniref:ABC transporter permease subunit n=1 Tax=Paragemmobacter amnigenus TaxID=2852097 RepID=A0ABS6J066_9RHOB|nr:ABC transporter permease subunit [Rhodobacter amnigenus]MBU9697133.1 ABC transporter permease subunit [Rhodobacter amnigenus]MBV4388360.1 ABC transporter permease subunit [Rhodobacter amnigenus]